MTREEIWKPIVDYEGYYEVSNLGRVRSVDRYVPRKNQSPQYFEGKILKPAINPAGYAWVRISNGRTVKMCRIHRLVAEAFIPNPNNYPIINHKDENKQNNSIDNLEWCTYSYNATYNNSMRARINTRNKNQSYGCEKKVYQYSLSGELVKIWKSLADVTRNLHLSCGCIANCCRNMKYRHTAYGYKWSYKPINNFTK